MNTTPLNLQAAAIHELNHKWWHDEHGNPTPRNPKNLLALSISEICEGLEGERKDLMDDKLPHRKMAEVEMADAKIRLLDFAAGFGLTLEPVNFPYGVAEDKGEALFDIMVAITLVIGPKGMIDVPRQRGIRVSRAIAQIEAYCRAFNYDLDGALAEKLEFNKTRVDHTHEARNAANGKKW